MKLETKIKSFLSCYPADTQFRIRAHELWRDEGEWTSNNRFTLAGSVDRDEVPEVCRGRWDVFKINYSPRARVSDLADIGFDPEIGINLECNFLPFVDIEPLKP